MQDGYSGVVSGAQGDTDFVGQLGDVAVTGTEGVRLEETAELQGIVWIVMSWFVSISRNILPILSSGKVT